MKKNKTIIGISVAVVCIVIAICCVVSRGDSPKDNKTDITVKQAAQTVSRKVIDEKTRQEQREKTIEANNEALAKIKADTESSLTAQAAEREEAARVAEEARIAREAAAKTVATQSYSQPSYYYGNSDYEEVESTDMAEVEEAVETSSEENSGTVETANGTVTKQDPSHFKRDGVIYDENGTRYTWYSSNVLHHYRTNEWSANSEGFYETSDGNLVVASEDYPEGTIIDTPYGTAEVLDSGCDSGTVDFYVNY